MVISHVPNVSVVIITKNEAHNIQAALQSVGWASDIVVVDAGSTDSTVDIARRYATRVTSRAWDGFGAQKNYATELAAHDWVLSLDADERVTADLASEIGRVMRSGPAKPAYRIPRTTWYLGRWIRSTDWYPDYQLRLYDRRVARWSTRPVHESVVVHGPVGRLRSEIRHYAYRDLSHHLATIDRYTTLAVDQLIAERRRARALDLLVRPPLAFLRNYVLRRGVRDGVPGLIVSLMNSYYVALKLTKLWARQRGHDTFTDWRPQGDVTDAPGSG